MRVTQNMMTQRASHDLHAHLSRMEGHAGKLVSGRRLGRPSDDPLAVANAMSYRASLDQLDQHLKNIDEGSAWLQVTDSALMQAGEVMRRARELAIYSANDTNDAAIREGVQREVDSLRGQLAQLANSTYGNQFVFAGTLTNTRPYPSDGPYVYQGNTINVAREIGPKTLTTVNITGNVVFDPMFSALGDLSTALGANDTTAIQNAITSIGSAEAVLQNQQAANGARFNRLEAQRERLLDIQINLSSLLSKTEDTDYTATLLQFKTAETVYKAALETGARSLQTNLFDYLR